MHSAPSAEIIFVGGAHGTGKSTLCRALATPLRAQHLTASELLGFTPLKQDPTGKAVRNVAGAQDDLIRALQSRTSNGGRFLLDGHFAVLNTADDIEAVPVATFEAIAPRALILVEALPQQITERMVGRDGKSMPLELLHSLLRIEQSHAQFLANNLDCGLIRCGSESNPKDLIAQLRRHLGGN